MNLGFFAKGNKSMPAALVEQDRAGACALKMHEDWGTTPAAIDAGWPWPTAMTCRWRSYRYRSLKWDSSRTDRRIKGRTVKCFPTEGVGGGHGRTSAGSAAGQCFLLANPTRPYTVKHDR